MNARDLPFGVHAGIGPTRGRDPDRVTDRLLEGALKRALERAGFTDVKTVLASGNVVFDVPAARSVTVERELEAAMQAHLGRVFPAIVRPVEALRTLLATDPYRSFRLEPGSKRIVTFLRAKPKTRPRLPVVLHGARILRLEGTEAFSAYVRTPHGPVFMTLIERTFGRDVTTRTWDTVVKVAR